jgi:branched-chain amino acid transport system substrate-binding protein
MSRLISRSGAAFAAAALLVLAAPRAQAADPVEIPVIIPLTGAYAYTGQLGKQTFTTVEALVNKTGGIHGAPLHFVFYDDQSSPQMAVQVAQQAVATKPVAIIGSEFVALCQAMEPITRGKVVQYCISPGVHPAYGTDMFSASIATDGMATAMIRFMREKNWKKIATITAIDASGQDAENQLKTAAALPENVAKGVTIVDAEHFSPSDQTVAAQMQRIRAANPDVIVMWNSGPQFGTVARAYNDAGLTIPAFTTNANLTFTFMKQFADFLPKELYFPAPAFFGPNTPGVPPRVRDAVHKFEDAMKPTGLPIDFGVGTVWDPPTLIVDGLRHLPAGATYAQLRDWILAQRDWAGIAGIYDFSNGPGAQRGLTVKDTMIVRWDAAKQLFVPASRLGGLPN